MVGPRRLRRLQSLLEYTCIGLSKNKLIIFKMWVIQDCQHTWSIEQDVRHSTGSNRELFIEVLECTSMVPVCHQGGPHWLIIIC